MEFMNNLDIASLTKFFLSIYQIRANIIVLIALDIHSNRLLFDIYSLDCNKYHTPFVENTPAIILKRYNTPNKLLCVNGTLLYDNNLKRLKPSLLCNLNFKDLSPFHL